LSCAVVVRAGVWVWGLGAASTRSRPRASSSRRDRLLRAVSIFGVVLWGSGLGLGF
jgi:hypothetical protein